MKLKQRPEDFSVKESYRYDEVEDGAFRVYMMDKQKISTFDAILRIQAKFGLKPGSVSYCGLKDKQGRTEQLIAVKGFDIDMQDQDLRVKFLGRTDKPLSGANTTSNRFAVTVREIRESELSEVTMAAAEVNRLGVVNYFDSQRFGSLKHGQGFIAKEIIRGDFETALRNFMAKPSELDRSDDAKVKAFWKENWGDWTAKCPFAANQRYFRILKSLRDEPTDFVSAFLAIDSDQRAMQLFTYQSYIWNESARRLLQLLLPREAIFPMPYQAGTLLHHKDAPSDVLRKMREMTVPLIAPNTTFTDAKVEEAVQWVMGKEKLKLEDLRIEESPKLLFFKHEERPFLVVPQKLVVGRQKPDEMNRGFIKVNIAFTLPPGSYATLMVKRIFHFGVRKEDEKYELKPFAPRPEGHLSRNPDSPSQYAEKTEHERLADRPSNRPVGRTGLPPSHTQFPRERGPKKPTLPAPMLPIPSTPSEQIEQHGLGFRDRQKQKKTHKIEARKLQPNPSKSKKN
jgi:tRNA pseudouridine13 synthase